MERSFAAGVDPLQVALRELSVVFQPLIDLRPGAALFHGVECLSRGPAGTPLADPVALFEYARRRGAQPQADRACFSRSLRAVAALPPVPRFSINVHARTLSTDPDFTGFVLDELCRVQIDPVRLTLDLVAPHEASPPLLEAIASLRSVGIGIAIDDLGRATTDFCAITGWRPDYLKLDRAFIRRPSSDEVKDLLVRSVVRLAHSLGAQVVAEGVETLEELDAVMGHGIQLVQGHFFGEPMGPQALLRTGLFERDLERAG